jgi:hypothetical protein
MFAGRRRNPVSCLLSLLFLLSSVARAAAQAVPQAQAAPEAPTAAPLVIARVKGKIVIDGDLSDAAWKDTTPIEKWWETNPGDNVEPKVRNVGRMTYDDKYLYVGLEFDDPDPKQIRAPYADRDNVDSTTDYGGIIIDADYDKKTAILFLANPRGIQYDAINSDVNSSEDNAPDWFWDSAGKIGDHGWTLEIRIPFSSLRYPKRDPQTWGIMLYRNYPRDRRYQIFSTRLPKDANCFICNVQPLLGLTGLPAGGGWVVAPFAVVSQESTPRGDLGSDMVTPAPHYDAVLLWRADLEKRFPRAVKQLRLLQSKISQHEITDLNAEVESGSVNESQAAANFLRDKLSLKVKVEDESVARQIWRRTLEHCDLSAANLEGASWHRATLSHCELACATLVDARLERAAFSDCSLRGANLEIVRSPEVATLAGARFVRCDLRDTRWAGRDLGGATFIDCKLFGAHGAAALTGVVIERPDLSRLGDGSQLATQSEVVARWTATRAHGGLRVPLLAR